MPQACKAVGRAMPHVPRLGAWEVLGRNGTDGFNMRLLVFAVLVAFAVLVVLVVLVVLACPLCP